MRAALSVALVFAVVTIGCNSVLGIEIATYSCEDLKDDVVELSEEQQNPFSPAILKISDIDERVRTATRLVCTGTARLNNGSEERILYHIEEDADGDFLYGYEIDPEPSSLRRFDSPTPISAPTHKTDELQPSESPSATKTKSGTGSTSVPIPLSTSTQIPSATQSPSLSPRTAVPDRHAVPSTATAAPTILETPCCVSIGSPQEDVVVLIGEPDSVQDWGSGQPKTWGYFTYGTTISVDPLGGRVVSWDYTGPLSESPFQVLEAIRGAPLSNPDGHISIDSTAGEVVSIIGEPDYVYHWGRGQVIAWQYYNSTISFDTQNKQVVSWDYTGPISESPFQVLEAIRGAPLSNPDGHISIGSTAGEVASIIGEPDYVYHWGRGQVIAWQYYNSTISFDTQNKQVVSWDYTGPISESPFQVLEAIRGAPLSNPDGHISIGSTAGEVVSIIGEPDYVYHWGRGQVIAWQYYNSTISFDTQNERVTDWYYDGPEEENPFR